MCELDDDFDFINWWYCASCIMRRNLTRMTSHFKQNVLRYLPDQFKQYFRGTAKEHSKFSQELTVFNSQNIHFAKSYQLL